MRRPGLPAREQVVAHCLSLPGSQSTFPFGEDVLVLKVGGKMFALVDLTDRRGVTLKADPDRAADLVGRFSQVTPGYHLDKRHWITVRLDDPLPDGVLVDLLEESYELVVAGLPRRLRPVPPAPRPVPVPGAGGVGGSASTDGGSAVHVVMLGPPGSGKGTQGVRLAATLGVPHVSSGEVLRQTGDEQVRALMATGELLDDEVMERVLWTRLVEPDAARGLVLDGFPRDAGQAAALDRHLAERGERVDVAVLLDAPREELVARLLHRGEVEDRPDDTPATIAHRLEVYDTQTAPLVAYYEQAGVLRRVDGSGDVDAIAARLRDAVC